MPTIPQQLRAAYRLAKSEHWTVDTNGAGHLTWISPRGTKVFTPKSPGGGRSHQNTVKKLQNAGLRISSGGTPLKVRDGRRSGR